MRFADLLSWGRAQASQAGRTEGRWPGAVVRGRDPSVGGSEQEPIPVHRDSYPNRSANWMRRGEITSLTWGQIDFVKRIVGVGKAKTAAGTGRQIPMNDELFDVLAAHADWYTLGFGSGPRFARMPGFSADSTT